MKSYFQGRSCDRRPMNNDVPVVKLPIELIAMMQAREELLMDGLKVHRCQSSQTTTRKTDRFPEASE